MVEILHQLSYALNFTVELVQADSYGSLLENGTWTGCIGLITQGKADFSFNEFSITYERYDKVWFANGPWADVVVIVLIFCQRCHADFSFCNVKFIL